MAERVADIDILPIWTLPVADLVFSVADIVVADMVCGRLVVLPGLILHH